MSSNIFITMIFFQYFYKKKSHKNHTMSKFSITVQPTNNENIVKFVTNSFLTQAKSYEFSNIDQAKPSPLAQELFYLPFVEKFNIVDWPSVQDEVAQSITDYLESGKDVITEEDTSKKVPVTVYAESTPNPGVMKYVANKPLADGVFEFKTIEDAVEAPLAKALFSFPFVKEIFISANYVSVTKYNVVEWLEVSNDLRSFIRTIYLMMLFFNVKKKLPQQHLMKNLIFQKNKARLHTPVLNKKSLTFLMNTSNPL
jgi:hypothetical protein